MEWNKHTSFQRDYGVTHTQQGNIFALLLIQSHAVRNFQNVFPVAEIEEVVNKFVEIF